MQSEGCSVNCMLLLKPRLNPLVCQRGTVVAAKIFSEEKKDLRFEQSLNSIVYSAPYCFKDFLYYIQVFFFCFMILF